MEFIIQTDVLFFTLLILASISIYKMGQMDKKEKAVYYLKKGTIILYFAIGLNLIKSYIISNANVEYIIYLKIIILLILILEQVILYFLFKFLYNNIGNDNKISIVNEIILVFPVILTIVLSIIDIFTNSMISINSELVIKQEILYNIQNFSKYIYVIYGLLTIFKNRSGLSKIEKLVFYSYVIIQIYVITINMQIYIWPVISLYLIVIYGYLGEKYISKDALTRVKNIHTLEDNLYQLDSKNKVDYTLVYIDIDNFKNINDTYGMIEGDNVLRKFANTLQKVLHKPNYVARYNGDKFLVYLETVNLNEIEEILIILYNNIRNQNMEMSKGYTISYTYVYSIYNREKYSTYLDLFLELKRKMSTEKERQKNEIMDF